MRAETAGAISIRSYAELLCDIRREHPSVSVKVILRTLPADAGWAPA